MFNSTSHPIRYAVRYALLTGAVGSIVGPLQVQAQAQPQSDEDNITEVIVTGSRIRRVDAETANPVFVYDNEAIQKSGTTTLGELMQQIPSVAGAATNPSTNNGGGDGDSNIELRGLSPERTLVLLNGRRIGPIGYSTGAVDINMIPANLIERVEVLKEGAGAIYGSDAIAGVVNFITKKPESGSEASYQYGVTAEDDGKSHNVNLSIGTAGDRGGVLVGVNYNKEEAISAGDREFSRFARYLYNAAVYGPTTRGSSRAPGGRIYLPASYNALYNYNCPVSSGEISVTRIAGAAGTAPADFRCFRTSGDTDFYNFQPVNLLLTPQERGSLFTIANYEINDHVELYTELLYNRTSSGYQIAPLPFDSRSDDIVLSAQSIYNPFRGTLQEFGGIDATNPNAVWRLEALGGRRNTVSKDTSQVNIGARGDLFGNWQWDTTISYGHLEMDRRYEGYMYQPAIQNAFGPSFIAPDGTPTCGTQLAPIRNCTPVNIFNLTAPGQAAALATIASPYTDSYTYQSKAASVGLNGDIVDLPAGSLSAAVGYEYRDLAGVFNTDYLTEALAPLYLTCLLSSEACSASSRGSYDVSELYAEVLVPILKDLPGVASLNVTLGTRYSDYSTFGDTTNSMIQVEYRPIQDLLVRASFSEVFRAPTIYNLYHGPTKDAPTFNDPCTGLTSAQLAGNPNLVQACEGVTPDDDFSQPNSQVDGIWLSNSSLKPETGEVLTYGVVYEPSAIQGLSLTVDFWKYELEDLITRVDPNYAADQCVATGSAAFCDLLLRNSDGTILVIREPYVNLGTLETKGIDFSIKYAMPEMAIGTFRVSLDTTYIDTYRNVAAPGSAPVEVAGTFDRQFGNYAKWRGTLGVDYRIADFDARVNVRYIDAIRLTDPDGLPGIQPDLKIGERTYVDLTVGYTLPTNTRFQAGVLNLQDKQPPILYQNNVTNANTDVATYDVIGRRFFAGVIQKF